MPLRTIALSLVALVAGTACAQDAPQTPELLEKWRNVSFYTLKSKSLEGDAVDLSQYAGKVTLVVNVASRCGYTPQYAGLEKVYDQFKDRGLVVLGFPSGDFGGQELDDPKAIREFCTSRYSVSFPMFEKVTVKAGDSQCEVYQYLGTRTGKLPGWNFSKYLVGRDGQPIAFWASGTKPDSKEMIDAIEKALAAEAPAPAAPATEAPAKSG